MQSTTLVSTEQLAQRLDEPTWVVFDCRFILTDPEARRRAYVAAHIPGAANRPFEDNLDLDGIFLGARRVARRLPGGAGRNPAATQHHMCGSAVTACHNLLAMEIAGLPGARLYPGSWSEWITDPSHPIIKED